MRNAPILPTMFALLTLAVLGCITTGQSVDIEGTVEARVRATLDAVETPVMPTESTPDPTDTPGPPEATVTPSPDIEAEEYAVYSAMIQQNPIGYDLGSPLVIKQQTNSGLEQFERTLEETDRVPAELADSYRSRNAARYLLDPDLDLEQEYILMPPFQFDRIFLGEGQVWPKFQEVYPKASGFIGLTRVGFDADGSMALVEMGYRCGELCGSGGLYVLVDEGDGWEVKDTLMIWES